MSDGFFYYCHVKYLELRRSKRPYCCNVSDSNVLLTERKLTLLKQLIERISSEKYSTVKMMENGQPAAKKFGIDCGPDCVLQCEEEGQA